MDRKKIWHYINMLDSNGAIEDITSYEALWAIIKDVINGVADEEAKAVLSTATIYGEEGNYEILTASVPTIEACRLTSTILRIEYKELIPHATEWWQEMEYTLMWEIPHSWELFDMMDGNLPTGIQTLLDECRPWNQV